MKKNTALSWANSIGISEREFDECLIEIGYQEYNSVKDKLELTTKGKEHASKILGKIYWDIDANFEVMKLRGKKTHKYFYCDSCGSYNKIPEDKQEEKTYLCSKCGVKNNML